MSRKGNLAEKLQTCHDHAGNPEKDNIIAAHKGACGKKVLQIFGLFGASP